MRSEKADTNYFASLGIQTILPLLFFSYTEQHEQPLQAVSVDVFFM